LISRLNDISLISTLKRSHAQEMTIASKKLEETIIKRSLMFGRSRR
jgi:hypothetical protein